MADLTPSVHFYSDMDDSELAEAVCLVFIFLFPPKFMLRQLAKPVGLVKYGFHPTLILYLIISPQSASVTHVT